MGSVIDCGVGLNTKNSPCRAAIEKAQAELRQEYDVREERKRELEFLEKGGNPLDFKFGHAASISLQSTSFTDNRAEQYVISEAKGSFALAASPHGDSIESSGRPGESVGRDTNTADNLLFFDGENSNPAGEKIAKRTGKRGNACLLEQSSEGAGGTHAKEAEDSLIFHLGVKNQAYARRNRSKSSRDGHGNKTTIPSSFPDHMDGNRSIREARAEKYGASYVSNSKSASPKGNVLAKASATDNKLDMELDGVQTHHASADKINNGVRDEAEVDISKTLQNTQKSNQCANSPGGLVAKDEATSVCSHSVSLEPTGTVKDISSFEGVNDSSIPDKDVTGVLDDEFGRKNCDIGSTAEDQNMCSVQTDTHADMEDTSGGNANTENCAMVKTEEGRSNGESKELVYQKISDDNGVRANGQLIAAEAPITATDELRPTPPNLSNSTIQIKDEVELCDNRTDTVPSSRILKTNGEIVSKPDRKLNNSLGDNSHSINKTGVITSSSVVPSYESSSATLSKRGTSTTSAIQNSAVNHLKLAKKAREEAILKEARIIEANLRRTAQLSSSYKSSEKRRKCHWDFVLEEMAWMANDFMQERLWKTATAAHICHRIASTGRSQFEQEIVHRKKRTIARTMAKAVMHFWHCVDAFRTAGETPNGLNGECNSDLARSCEVNGEPVKHQGNKDMETGNISLRPSIQGYAIRFLEYDSSKSIHPVLAEAPPTPDRIIDAAILEKSWEGELSEESLFYTVPPGAMQAYREAVESQWFNYKKMVNPMSQEDCEASPCDSLPNGPRKNELEEEEGETGSYVLPGAFEGAMSSRFTIKKKKIFQKYAARPYNLGTDFSFDPCLEGKSANRPVIFIGKRPSSTPNAGLIPTKRVRTASRQRVVSPFGSGATGSLQITNKTDVSSGDTNSLQDDQSSMHGGSQSQKNMEVESTADFEKQFTFDSSETSTKSKKKKFKHSGYSTNLLDSGVLVSGKGSMFDQRLQADSMVQQEQRDQLKRRLESQHHESNGNIGIYGQHVAKKPKLLKQPAEPSQEGILPATGSIPSPAASQMSNMSNQNKFIKIIANRDRGKKSKSMKMAAGQSSSGISWTTFEDQALVVFVHDMGPNWELVSDAINNTLQFKCIFRKPQECKERHKILMDKSAGDGADSAEDSGSSQPYPSTLPGIPKGSARQLFQRLQGPMEEDTLKSHFEKIILIGQKFHSYRNQNDTQDQKQMTAVHSSHFVALSQTCPNNLGGGLLSPLDLCDAISSSPDVLTCGFQGSHTSGAAISNHQGALSPVLSTSSANTMLPGSSGIVPGSNLPSTSTPLNAPARDAQRYCVPRAACLPVDDQQKMHYAQMLSGRNIQQSSMSVPGALPVGVDRGAHMLPAGNGMGMMGGRTMPMSRPGFQGIISPGMPMVSNGNMLAGSGGMPNPASIHPGAVSGPLNSMSRPRPGQNTEDHRQMMIQDLQIQVSQGNGQAVAPFGTMSAPFSTTTGLPLVQSYPAQQHQQSHQIPQQPHMLGNPHHPHIQGVNHLSPQQQAYTMRLAKERQLQQRIMPQSQQPYSSSSMSPLQSSSQIQQQTQTSCATLTSSQAQHSKQQMSRNSQSSSGMPNQMMKQRQRQQAHQQQPRHQQQQKQLLQQQAKLAKGLGSGAMLMHQNPAADPSPVSSLPAAPRNQVPEKHLMLQGPGFFPGNSTMPQSASHQKLYSRPPPQSSKQIPPLPSHSDTCNQNPVPGPSNHAMIASQQPPHPSSTPLAAPPPPQQQRQLNQSMPRVMFQQSRQLSSDGRVQSSGEQAKVNQMIQATSLPRGTDSASSAPSVSSAMKWKPEPSYDTTSASPTAQLAGSAPGNLVGTDTLVPSSNEGAAQGQFSGSVSVDGHTVGGQWQPTQQAQTQGQFSGSVSVDGHTVGGQWQPTQQAQTQPQLQLQHPLRQGGQGNLYARPSNSGPG